MDVRRLSRIANLHKAEGETFPEALERISRLSEGEQVKLWAQFEQDIKSNYVKASQVMVKKRKVVKKLYNLTKHKLGWV